MGEAVMARRKKGEGLGEEKLKSLWGRRRHWTERRLLVDLSDWMEVARTFVLYELLYDEVAPLRYHRGKRLKWTGNLYQELDETGIKDRIKDFLANKTYELPDGEKRFRDATKVKSTPARIKKVLAGITTLGSSQSHNDVIVFVDDDVEPPTWFPEVKDGREEFYPKLIAFLNGLLDYREPHLYPHTPEFFNLDTRPYEYEPSDGIPHELKEILAEETASRKEKRNRDVDTFVQERCTVGKELRISEKKLYRGWWIWCKEQGIDPGTTWELKKPLLTVRPKIKERTKFPKPPSDPTILYGGKRIYVGISLEKAQGTEQERKRRKKYRKEYDRMIKRDPGQHRQRLGMKLRKQRAQRIMWRQGGKRYR
jgi:hypothetical protein